MHPSPGSGRVLLLVVLLVATCFLADWTDDYYSFAVATEYSVLQNANGHRLPVSGGVSSSESAAFAAFSLRPKAGAPQASALETVFGSSGSTTSDDAAPNRLSLSSRSLGRTASSADAGAFDTGNSMNLGLGGNRPGLGLSAGTSGLSSGRSSAFSPY